MTFSELHYEIAKLVCTAWELPINKNSVESSLNGIHVKATRTKSGVILRANGIIIARKAIVAHILANGS